MIMPPDITDLLLAAGDAAYDWDLRDDSISWFGAWKRAFTGKTPPQDSQGLYHALHPDDRHLVFSDDAHMLDRQFRINHPDGEILWIHERGLVENDENNQPIRQRGVWRIVEQPAQGLSAVDAQNRDSLTGCFKRRIVHSYLTRAIEEAKGAQRSGAYLVISVDKMSFVNEAVGTEMGDAVLRSVAVRLAQTMPTRAILGRVGGDVFGILLPEPLGDDLEIVAERIVQDFRNTPILIANAPLHITVSIGGVRIPAIAKGATEAMIFAEQALHTARQQGRNTFVAYVDSPERAHENRQLLELGERIKRSFKNRSFRLAYQPIVAADTGAPVCYEALVRMFSDDGTPITAAVFVPMIEQLGLVLELDKLVLDMAVQDMEASPTLSVAINISGLTASQSDWPAHMKKILEPRPDVARRLIIEITETAALVNIAETQHFVETIRALGGRVSLDDFGAGSTSIRYLRELGLSIMKIDKDLLKDVISNREQQHLVSVLIELARGLGIQTVAEGVETIEVANWLRGARVDYMQGYYFGKPSLEKPHEIKTAASGTIIKPSFSGRATAV